MADTADDKLIGNEERPYGLLGWFRSRFGSVAAASTAILTTVSAVYAQQPKDVDEMSAEELIEGLMENPYKYDKQIIELYGRPAYRQFVAIRNQHVLWPNDKARYSAMMDFLKKVIPISGTVEADHSKKKHASGARKKEAGRFLVEKAWNILKTPREDLDDLLAEAASRVIGRGLEKSGEVEQSEAQQEAYLKARIYDRALRDLKADFRDIEARENEIQDVAGYTEHKSRV